MGKRNISAKSDMIIQSKPAFLTGKRIYLRPLETGDLEAFYCWFNNPELRQFLKMSYPVSSGQERDFIENAMKSTDQIILAIILKQENRLIGDIFISPLDKIHRKAFLGIAIGDPGNQSKGYGTEAMELMITYAFNTLNLHRIELSVYSFNQRAFKCYKKLGFIEEGRSREAYFSNGHYHDILQMGLLEEEWRQKKHK